VRWKEKEEKEFGKGNVFEEPCQVI